MRRILMVTVVTATLVAAVRADDWPQWLGPRRDAVWRETGILTRFPAGGPPVRWRAPLGAGYAGPAVAGGRVFLMDRQVPPGARVVANSFARTGGPGQERVLCLDAETGKVLWQHAYDVAYRIMYPLGPRCTPTVDGDRVYTLGAMGHLRCLAAADGRVVWAKDLPEMFDAPVPDAGFASHPLVDGRRLICFVGGKDSLVVALDKETGAVLWKSGNAPHAGYSSPVIGTAAGRRVLVAWAPNQISALDPETGGILWSQPFQSGMNMNVAMPRLEGDLLFLSAFFDGSLMLKLAAEGPPAVAWRGTDRGAGRGANALMSTPLFRDGHVYVIDANGELRCLEAATGKRVWETLAATTDGKRGAKWANAFLVAHEDRVFLANERGELILARLTPQGYEEIGRAKVIEPTHSAGGRDVVWSHPAFAQRCAFLRNDKEVVCVNLAEGG